MTIANLVTVSIVVNTVDRATSLATLLAALEHQSYPNFELIVVVGPTHDDTLAVLDGYVGRVRVLRCGRANLSESRNIGLLAAHGEIVAFIDDDAVPSYHWLAQVVAAFDAAESAAQDIAIVGGSVYLVHPQQPTIQHWLGMMSDLGEQQDVRLDGTTRPEGMGVFWTERPMGANMAFRRRTLLAAGGFDGYYQWVFDDADVAMRLALAGHGVRSLTEAPVYHVPASSRNRVARTHSGRWWIVTKASTYFAVQNGRAARGSRRARCCCVCSTWSMEHGWSTGSYITMGTSVGAKCGRGGCARWRQARRGHCRAWDDGACWRRGRRERRRG